jgi:hypothetical protein
LLEQMLKRPSDQTLETSFLVSNFELKKLNISSGSQKHNGKIIMFSGH